jgi:hypothetical protein
VTDHPDAAEPDEVFETQFVRLARWGRLITVEQSMSEEEHYEMVSGFIDEIPSLVEERAEVHAEVLELLGHSDVIELLAQASIGYLHIDPDTYQESTHDQSPAHVEYLAGVSWLSRVGSASLQVDMSKCRPFV